MDRETRFQKAIAQVQEGDYSTGMLELSKLHQEGFQKEKINLLMEELCYTPNILMLRENYVHNKELLEQYPLISGWSPRKFEDLDIHPYIIGETECCPYSKKDNCFLDDVAVSGSVCLKQMEKSRTIKNMMDMNQLRYLERNMRKSEDLARENHIYLYYESQDLLELLMQIDNLYDLLQDKKIVFLCGYTDELTADEIQQKFCFDYAGMTPKMLELDDIKRMVFGWKIANASGTSFLADVMDFHPNLLTIPDCFFTNFYPFFKKCLCGKNKQEAIDELKQYSDEHPDKQFVLQLTRVNNSSKTISDELLREMNKVTPNQFLDELSDVLNGKEIPTAAQWVAAFHLAYSRCHGRRLDTSVIPEVFMYPHDDMFSLIGMERERVDFCLDLTCSYPDFRVISMIRDPITHAGSTTRFLAEGHKDAKNVYGQRQMDLFYGLMFGTFAPKDFYFPKEHPIYDYTRIIRFEDLKMNPKATLESLTDFLDLPMTDSLFQTTWCGLSRAGVDTENKLFEGFDIKPLYNAYDKYLSVFDKYRIECIMARFMSFYGYIPQYYDNQEFTNAEIMEMMKLPFLCESIETVASKEMKKQAHVRALHFAQMAVQLRTVEIPFHVEDLAGSFAPFQWLKPKEDLLEVPLYMNRISSCPEL